ncbi:MAG: hypothetical protein LBG62_03850 [Candidatus Methanoplasma sp.]|jgi:predicted RNA-binding Zn-ribbon protein involved in translation (DUF1610 family)|nr:hypothetical protein [Candidatus Methanoplasma sp.]
MIDALICKKCGGRLRVGERGDRGVCLYCGTEAIIAAQGGRPQRHRALFSYNGATVERLATDRVEFCGKYRDGAGYGDAAPMTLAVRIDGAEESLRFRMPRMPASKVSVCSDGPGAWILVADKPGEVSVNDAPLSGGVARIGPEDVIRYGPATIRIASV